MDVNLVGAARSAPLIVSLALLVMPAAAGDFSTLGIYGEDGRRDLYEASPAQRRLAAGTVALFRTREVRVDARRGKARLETSTYGESLGLARSERFWSQPAGAFCSGALVGPDLVLTAGHCLTSASKCRETAFVFGFAIERPGDDPGAVPASDVYSCAELVESVDEAAADWALVRLDRRVEGRRPLEVGTGARLKPGAAVFTIGHPSGLPAKVAAGARVREVREEDFTANLDTYAGNSGSPVFDQASLEIVGVLVRGGRDFEQAGGGRPAARRGRRSRAAPPARSGAPPKGRRSAVDAEGGGQGEDATLASAFAGGIKRALAGSRRLAEAREKLRPRRLAGSAAARIALVPDPSLAPEPPPAVALP